TSLLLPDGRVLIGGGGQPGPQLNLNAEIFSPPYLFDGDQLAARPVITSAPSKVQYNESFEIQVQGDAASVSLVKTGAVTHSFDASTRWMELEISGTDSQRAVRAPANANLAPPGTYMLFVLDSDGTPSVAQLIEIDPGDPVLDPVEPNPKVEPGTIAEAQTLEELLAATDYDPEVHGNILRLYRAFFGREPDLEGARYWISGIYQSGHPFAAIIEWFASPEQLEFAAQYSDIAPEDYEAYLERVYDNMLGRVPDGAGFEYWRSMMADGTLNRAQVVLYVGLDEEFINRFPYQAAQ
ncbi:MAG: galactose oxidase-like domain-containing protein, partial [Acidimicrobiales bacterium]